MSLFKGSVLNLAGGVIPALVAIPALAYLARELSPGLLGVFMLIWALVGYGGVFDAGLGKAVVRHLSINSAKHVLHGRIVGTALAVVTVVGVLVAAVLCASADWLVLNVFNVQAVIAHESAQALRIASWCVPVFLASTILQSYLEGMQRFVAFNVYRSLSGALVYLLPVLALWSSGDFVAAMWGFLVARLISLAVVAATVAKRCPASTWLFHRSMLHELISFGGWLTVTNLISPFMVYMDRLVIARLVGAGAVAAYTAPAELVNRMSFLPAAISRALFPRLASLGSDTHAARAVRRRAYLYMACLTFPVGAVAIVAAKPLITLWLGEKFAEASPPVFSVLVLGFLLNCLALIPYSSLQARGLSKITAQVHLAEVVPYLICLVIVTTAFGIIGAAWVWSARMLVDLLILWKLDASAGEGLHA